MSTKKEKDEKEQEQTQGQADTGTTAAPDPAEEAKKQAQAIIDAAKAEAAKIVEAGKAEAAKIVEAGKAEAQAAIDAAKVEVTTAPPKSDDEEMVPIRLFKDNDRYKDDVFVAVNGRRFQIKRGETVMVPKYIAEVLEQSMNQDEATANLITKQSEDYAAEAAKRGL